MICAVAMPDSGCADQSRLCMVLKKGLPLPMAEGKPFAIGMLPYGSIRQVSGSGDADIALER